MVKNLCKGNANERNENLLSNCRVQLIFCKITRILLKSLYLLSGRYYLYRRLFLSHFTQLILTYRYYFFI